MERLLFYVTQDDMHPGMELTSEGKIPEGCIDDGGSAVYASEDLAGQAIEYLCKNPFLQDAKWVIKPFVVNIDPDQTYVTQVRVYEHPQNDNEAVYGNRYSPYMPSIYAAMASDMWNDALDKLWSNNFYLTSQGSMVSWPRNLVGLEYEDGTWYYESIQPFYTEPRESAQMYIRVTASICKVPIVTKQEDVQRSLYGGKLLKFVQRW